MVGIGAWRIVRFFIVSRAIAGIEILPGKCSVGYVICEIEKVTGCYLQFFKPQVCIVSPQRSSGRDASLLTYQKVIQGRTATTTAPSGIGAATSCPPIASLPTVHTCALALGGGTYNTQ